MQQAAGSWRCGRKWRRSARGPLGGVRRDAP